MTTCLRMIMPELVAEPRKVPVLCPTCKRAWRESMTFDPDRGNHWCPCPEHEPIWGPPLGGEVRK